MPYSKYYILLADDDPDDCMLFTEVLRDLSIEQQPVCVSNGQQLIDFLKESIVLPDLLFLDINMPLKNGVAALKEIKEVAIFRNIPVVMLSTTKHPATVQETYRLGANLYACKPTSYSALVSLVQRILAMDVTGLLRHRSLERFLLEERAL
jgi:CheY-like chemotaxis protein